MAADDYFIPEEKKCDRTLEEMRQENNPKNEPYGHFTGRCPRCASRNLWDDNTAYGCNSCGAIFT